MRPFGLGVGPGVGPGVGSDSRESEAHSHASVLDPGIGSPKIAVLHCMEPEDHWAAEYALLAPYRTQPTQVQVAPSKAQPFHSALERSPVDST